MGKIRKYEVAEKLNISPGYLSDILHGNRRASWRLSKKLARLTGTSPVLWVDGPPEKLQEAFNKFQKGG